MIHFTERKHLIRWIMQNCTRKSVVRAMDEGTVEHLGAFSKLGPNSEPGWIVKVISEHGKVWTIEIIPWRHQYGIFISDLLPPWEYWDGTKDPLDKIANGFPMSLQDGDNPVEYARLRDERRN